MAVSKQQPCISCVVPCLNAAHFLDATLAALLNTAGEGDEIIAVYDQSSDNTLNVLERFAPRVKIVVRDPSETKGAAAAINRGFAEASGDIFCWLGADDYIFPWAFSVVRSVFAQHSDVSWITSTQPCVIRDGAVSAGRLKGLCKDSFLDGFTLPGERRGAGWLQQESTFWRRSLWLKAGARLDESLKIAFDFDLWARFFNHAEICGVDSLLAAFRYREGQLSGDSETISVECKRLLANARQAAGWKTNTFKESLLLLGKISTGAARWAGLASRFYCWKSFRNLESGFWKPQSIAFWP
jgi:glycosyltransferase involved in cell wall biosynthesis